MTNDSKTKWLNRRCLFLGGTVFAVLVVLCLIFLRPKSFLQQQVEAAGGIYNDYNMDWNSGRSIWDAAHRAVINGVLGNDRRSVSIWLRRGNVNDQWLQRHAAAMTEVPLHHLTLSKTRISDSGVAEISAIQDLVDLNLSQTDATDNCVAAILMLRNLNNLNIVGTRFSEAGVIALTGHQRLRNISLEGKLLTDAVVGQFNQSPQIRHIELHAPDAESLTRASQLTRVLSMDITNASDDLLPQLLKLTNVRYLQLIDKKLSAKSMYSLKEVFPKLATHDFMSYGAAEAAGVYQQLDNQKRILRVFAITLFVAGLVVVAFSIWIWRRWKGWKVKLRDRLVSALRSR